MIKTVSILGCGWLGLPFARKLISIGYCVKGSTTSPQKISVLKSSNIIPYQLTCRNKSVDGDNVADFFKTDVLFVNIPFRRDLENAYSYVDQMKAIIPYVIQGGVKLVVFASSTLVYPLNNQTAKEEDLLAPDDERAQALINAEQVFLKESRFRTTVIRFAGLYGPEREIAGFLKTGRVTSKDGDAPMNLIHLDDCVGIITGIIEKDIGGEIINACGDAHPLRKDLYTHAAIAMRVKPPVFEEKEKTFYKIISNEKVKNLIGYRFIHPGPWGWIDQESKMEQ